MAVRMVELAQELFPLEDLALYWSVRIFLTWHDVPIGSLDIANAYQSVSVETLAKEIAKAPDLDFSHEHLLKCLPPERMPEHLSVSVIIPTCNRPEDLRRCLENLDRQRTDRFVEVIVVDNSPGSGLTPPVLEKFPNVKLVNEWRPGASYARNAGIKYSQGDIIITIDDDVTPPPHWLEQLISPLMQENVMAVTGNILPLELETPAQQLFEIYGMGGLCRGFCLFKMDGSQLPKSRVAIPVWELGASANAAFWAKIFQHPEIGLWEERLGAGVPVGGGEDLFLFYKILRAGFTHVYTPNAYVWHKHRRDMASLRRQIYGYSQGIIAHHIMTLRYYADWRAIVAIATMPIYYYKRARWQMMGKLRYPISLLLQEVLGHFMAAWGLLKSYQHGKSQPLSPCPTIQQDSPKHL